MFLQFTLTCFANFFRAFHARTIFFKRGRIWSNWIQPYFDGFEHVWTPTPKPLPIGRTSLVVSVGPGVPWYFCRNPHGAFKCPIATIGWHIAERCKNHWMTLSVRTYSTLHLHCLIWLKSELLYDSKGNDGSMPPCQPSAGGDKQCWMLGYPNVNVQVFGQG